ncbi:MAG: sensor histidine kinase [Cytophagales bacterium]|nr:sensor histidine kinase [Cytophagales bacterium]
MSKPNKAQLRKDIIESLLIFLLGFCLEVFVFCQCWSPWDNALIQGSYSGFSWLLLWKGSVYLVSLLDRWVDWLRFPLRRLIATAIGVTLLVTAATFINHFIFQYAIYRTPLPDIFARYSFSWVSNVLWVTYGINIIMHGRGFLMNWKQAAIDIERMKTEQVASQYESLKNQVNPHFLFNSLNALSSLVYDDQKAAVQFIRKLSEVYRYVLDKKDQEVVPVKDEMAFVESYIYLQKIRFGDNLQLSIEGEQSAGFVPPLAIQVLVENAIKHNVVSSAKPLEIKIAYKRADIEVSNVINLKKTKDSTGTGLENLKARYAYLSNVPVDISDKEGVFKVLLPVLNLKP